jgi:hypothetical protein
MESVGLYATDGTPPKEPADVVVPSLNEVEALISAVASNRPSIFEMALLKSYYDAISFIKERGLYHTSRAAIFADSISENQVILGRVKYNAEINDSHMIGKL